MKLCCHANHYSDVSNVPLWNWFSLSASKSHYRKECQKSGPAVCVGNKCNCEHVECNYFFKQVLKTFKTKNKVIRNATKRTETSRWHPTQSTYMCTSLIHFVVHVCAVLLTMQWINTVWNVSYIYYICAVLNLWWGNEDLKSRVHVYKFKSKKMWHCIVFFLRKRPC